uniref:Uncharacterized protein n=1 Tax=Anopheles albimanus TaxID=7167 RepID=A0A182FYH7_ANOAL
MRCRAEGTYSGRAHLNQQPLRIPAQPVLDETSARKPDRHRLRPKKDQSRLERRRQGS